MNTDNDINIREVSFNINSSTYFDENCIPTFERLRDEGVLHKDFLDESMIKMVTSYVVTILERNMHRPISFSWFEGDKTGFTLDGTPHDFTIVECTIDSNQEENWISFNLIFLMKVGENLENIQGMILIKFTGMGMSFEEDNDLLDYISKNVSV